ncbi:CubicO group peptidase (beta-lactamase class C family) [Actinoplanes xinjiangensis]|jgi:D-alanyl-D-alanine-carboxypeptidase/D-alanyl-D-alanine-endopeptidase|uniref:CubicO group peptidase (Beta-lactamase class C family) n=1 Tax=Actinoplanes xinjiangensis TaxID=512350 RepID=A0A316FTW6_9ACTN|nr:CubicO group peptidase (beta-lactamase class C family) [Actinoplanes xinjiangensis]
MDVVTDLDELTRQAVQKLEPNRRGVVVAALTGGHTEVRASGGLTVDSRLEIGSVTKVFTSLILARLAEAGEVRLDQPLADFLPAPAGITLRHLATHTSGLPRLPKGMLLKALLRPNTPDPYAHCTADYLIENLSRIRPATPGTRFRYSNLGAGLLGLALSRHTGLSYGDLVAREITTPLGLTSTGAGGPVAPEYDAKRRPTAPWNLADLVGAGGLRSTAADLITFVRAHVEESPVTAAVGLSLDVEHRVNPFLTVRLGWMAQRMHPKLGGHLQIYHNGQTGGAFAFVGFDPEKRVGVVVLSDTARMVDGPAMELLRGLQSGV